MRVIVNFDKPLGELFDQLPENGTRRRVLRTLSEHFLLEGAYSFKDAIKSSKSNETISLLNDARDQICWLQRIDDIGAIQIAFGDKTLSELLDEEVLVDKIEDVQEPLRRGESRLEGFERKFLGLIKRAKRIEIVDPYIAINLAENKKPGTTWFLERVMENFDGILKLVSQKPINRDRQNLTKLTESKLQNIIDENHNFKGEVLLLFLDYWESNHNRRILLSFDSGQSASTLEAGLSTFDLDPFKESHEIKPANLMEYKTALSIACKSKNRYENRLHHSNDCICNRKD